jgi:hypothetical protein
MGIGNYVWGMIMDINKIVMTEDAVHMKSTTKEVITNTLIDKYDC